MDAFTCMCSLIFELPVIISSARHLASTHPLLGALHALRLGFGQWVDVINNTHAARRSDTKCFFVHVCTVMCSVDCAMILITSSLALRWPLPLWSIASPVRVEDRPVSSLDGRCSLHPLISCSKLYFQGRYSVEVQRSRVSPGTHTLSAPSLLRPAAAVQEGSYGRTNKRRLPTILARIRSV